LIHAHDRVMDAWEKEYSQSMWTHLPDTFGSDWALENMTEERLRGWSIERQDSGDPYSFAEKRIAKWSDAGLDPWGKKIIFSDGLDVYRIISLYEKFNSRTNVGFGWGTNLGNDLGLPPISIVVKLTQSQGYGVVKLSDNPAKSVGDPEQIECIRKLFGLAEGIYAECKY